MGVTRTVVREGAGRTPNAGEVVKAHYTGRLKDSGHEFDSSRDRGKPLTFVIGIGSVIKGWDEALLDMKVQGSKNRRRFTWAWRRLYQNL